MPDDSVTASSPKVSGALIATACIAVTLALVTGACDEWLQLSMPERRAGFADWLADIAAGIVTCAALLYVHHRT